VLKIDDIISAGDLSTGGDGDEGRRPPAAAWAAWAVWAVRCNHSVGYGKFEAKASPFRAGIADQQYSTADDGIDGVSNAIINPSDRDSMHRW